MSDLDDFDPNSMKHKLPIWGTYVPYRSPAFKSYTNRGHAANSLNCAGRGVMYEWVEDKWTEYARKEKNAIKCAHCGKQSELYGHVVDGGPEDYKFQRPTVCWDCHSKHFSRNAPKPLNYYQIGMMGDDGRG